MMRQKLILFCLFIFMGLFELVAQPYIYYSKDYDTTAINEDERMSIIDTLMRFDLHTLEKTPMSSIELENAGSKSWDQLQKYLCVYYTKNAATIYNLADTSKYFEAPLYGAFGILNLMYSGVHQKLFVFSDGSRDGNDTCLITAFNPIDNSVVSELLTEFSILTGDKSYYSAFFSADENYIYFTVYDEHSNRRKIVAYSVSLNKIVKSQYFSDIISSNEEMFSFYPGRNGIGVIESGIALNPESCFTIYNFDTGTKIREIRLNGDYHLYPLGNFNFAAFAADTTVETGIEDSPDNGIFSSGAVCIYDVGTGAIVKNIKLPWKGEFLSFDSYPNKLYYVLNYKTNPQVYVIDVDSISALYNVNTLSPAMAFAGSGGFTIEVLGKNLTAGSTVMWNGTQRTTAFVSDTLLRAEILTADVANAGAYKVTVKPADTTVAVTDTLVFSAVSSLPKPIRLEVNKITYNANNTATVYYGYDNANDKTVYIPHGTRNRFTPGSENRGQPTLFLPGKHAYAFKVENFTGTIAWHLLEREAKAKADCP